MDTKELFSQFFIEVVKLFVSGILGGGVVSFFNFRVFKAQKRLDSKYELQRKKLDALRDIDFMLNWLYMYIFSVAKKPSTKVHESDGLVVDTINKIHSWDTLFLDDKEMLMALQKIEILVDPSRNTFLHKKQTSKATLIAMFNEIRMTVRNKIVDLQNS